MDNVHEEWEKVKHEPSLHSYYGNQKEYQRWRSRFITAGLVQKTTRTWTLTDDPVAHKKRYRREYYQVWRKNNKQKVREYAYNHYKKRLLADIAEMVCSNPVNAQ